MVTTTEVGVTGASNEVVDVVWLLKPDKVVVGACDRVVDVITGATDGSTEQATVNKNRNATMPLQKVLTEPEQSANSGRRDGLVIMAESIFRSVRPDVQRNSH
ncbi:MAG: hypothetical protein ACJZ57_11275 [Candidatus Poriferisodalaceae bacterium]